MVALLLAAGLVNAAPAIIGTVPITQSFLKVGVQGFSLVPMVPQTAAPITMRELLAAKAGRLTNV
jgi:hypothetical protein